MNQNDENAAPEKNCEFLGNAHLKHWELIAANLSDADWTWGYTTLVNLRGETLYCVDAHRGDGKRYLVHSDELLTAFLELEQQVRQSE